MNKLKKIIAMMLVFVYCSTQSVYVFANNKTSINATTSQTKTVSPYTVIVPETIPFGEVELQKDATASYKIDIEINDGFEGKVVIDPDRNTTLKNDKNKELIVTNNLTQTTVEESKTINSSLKIAKNDIDKALHGNYQGSINFDFTYVEQELADYTKLNEAIANIPSDLSIYTDETVSELNKVIDILDTFDMKLPIEKQSEVDKLAADLQSAIDNLIEKEEEKPPTTLEDGKYTATPSFRKDGAFNTLSLCDPLFSKTVDIEVKGDMAKLQMRVINPIPNFPDAGTPLKNIKFKYNNKTYNATLNTKDNDKKYFPSNPTFISKAGNYTTALISVDVPKQALLESVNGKLMVDTFVSAVMNSDVKFYVSLSKFKDENGNDVGVVVPPTTNPDNNNGGSTGGGNIGGGSSNPGTNNQTEDLKEAKYSATVSLRKSTAFNQSSMANPLFHNKADIEIVGNNAKITMYVIDPIPAYKDEGTPLKNVKLFFGGKTYNASISKSSSDIKSFGVASGFIEKAGNYPTSRITVTVPKEAVEQSVNQKLKASAFVSAVMNVTQEFYLVFTDLKAGSTSSADSVSDGVYEQTQDSVTDSMTDDNTLDKNSNSILSVMGQSKFITGMFIVALLILVGGIGYYVYWQRKQNGEIGEDDDEI